MKTRNSRSYGTQTPGKDRHGVIPPSRNETTDLIIQHTELRNEMLSLSPVPSVASQFPRCLKLQKSIGFHGLKSLMAKCPLEI
ncbi:hypothetical protein Y1Q_0012593 [Alligator mississippiensis]|uniref:Uncharacterized protein n=1 Tax=Alligator mississippiensis TaxID=8496 RepID=A0A151M868_ALLMI|nr:hypothetical protein Y1Q_0012593 [Alligator mississippiensis]